MPPLSLSLDVQWDDITARLASIQEDLDELGDLMTCLINEREKYRMWILKNAYNLGLAEPDSFLYQFLQKRTNQWNIQYFATEETIEDLKKREDTLIQQREELKNDLLLLLQNN